MGSETIRETQTSLQVVDTPLATLHAHPRNPRTITPARLKQLCATLDAERDMLQARPIVALPDGTVIAGNQRLAAALELGWQTIPTVFADLDDERAVRWMLLDNRGFGADDAGMVAELLAEIEGAGSDLLLTGYETGETDRLLRAYRLRDKDPDDAPPLPTTAPRSQRGEVYELGPHRLMCGDATSAEDVARLLGGESADLTLTDPPYGIDKIAESGKNAYSAFDDSKALVAEIAALWLPIARDVSTNVVFSSGVTRQWLYPEPDWVLCWFYGGGQLRSPWGFNCWQPFLCYGKDPSLAGGRGARPDAVDMNVPANAGDLDHPCPKPVMLWSWLISRLIFDEDSLIFDPFAGAGTTMIAAEIAGHRATCMEIDPAYCDVIRDRYEAFVD